MRRLNTKLIFHFQNLSQNRFKTQYLPITGISIYKMPCHPVPSPLPLAHKFPSTSTSHKFSTSKPPTDSSQQTQELLQNIQKLYKQMGWSTDFKIKAFTQLSKALSLKRDVGPLINYFVGLAKEKFGENSTQYRDVVSVVGQICEKSWNFEKAEQMFLEYYRVTNKYPQLDITYKVTMGLDSSHFTENRLSHFYFRNKIYDKAAEWSRKLRNDKSKFDRLQPSSRLLFYTRSGLFQRKSGNYQQYFNAFQQAQNLYRKHPSILDVPQHRYMVLAQLARLHVKLHPQSPQHLAQSKKLIKMAAQLRKKKQIQNDQLIFLNQLYQCYENLWLYEEASRVLDQIEQLVDARIAKGENVESNTTTKINTILKNLQATLKQHQFQSYKRKSQNLLEYLKSSTTPSSQYHQLRLLLNNSIAHWQQCRAQESALSLMEALQILNKPQPKTEQMLRDKTLRTQFQHQIKDMKPKFNRQGYEQSQRLYGEIQAKLAKYK